LSLILVDNIIEGLTGSEIFGTLLEQSKLVSMVQDTECVMIVFETDSYFHLFLIKLYHF
jgi:hypothetical protein